MEPNDGAPIRQEVHREGIARLIYDFQADFLSRNLQQSDIDASEQAGGVVRSISASIITATVTPNSSHTRPSGASDAELQPPKTSTMAYPRDDAGKAP